MSWHTASRVFNLQHLTTASCDSSPVSSSGSSSDPECGVGMDAVAGVSAAMLWGGVRKAGPGSACSRGALDEALLERAKRRQAFVKARSHGRFPGGADGQPSPRGPESSASTSCSQATRASRMRKSPSESSFCSSSAATSLADFFAEKKRGAPVPCANLVDARPLGESREPVSTVVPQDTWEAVSSCTWRPLPPAGSTVACSARTLGASTEVAGSAKALSIVGCSFATSVLGWPDHLGGRPGRGSREQDRDSSPDDLSLDFDNGSLAEGARIAPPLRSRLLSMETRSEAPLASQHRSEVLTKSVPVSRPRRVLPSPPAGSPPQLWMHQTVSSSGSPAVGADVSGRVPAYVVEVPVRTPVQQPKQQQQLQAPPQQQPQQLGDCALCGATACCEQPSCFCKDCDSRFEVLGPTSPKFGSTVDKNLQGNGGSRQPASSEGEFSNCVLCGARFACGEHAQSSVLCGRCLGPLAT